jgi:tetratricopeptide (TPR) repeat protein
MNLNLTRMLSLVLAFGFFISCTGTSVLVSDIIDEMDTQSLRTTSQQMLDENPYSASGNHMAGMAAFREARELYPENRADSYTEMASRFEVALENLRDQNAHQHIMQTRTQAWEYEFKATEQLLTNDASSEKALSHARNATIIQPDSLLAFAQAAHILIAQGNLAEATEYLQPVVNSGEAHRFGNYYETYAFLQTRQGDYDSASSWYQRSINWMIDHDRQTLQSTGNDISRGSLLNAYHGAVNTLSEAGYTNEAIFYLEHLSSKLENNTIYLEMLIVQYFNVIRSTALDSYGSLNAQILDENILRIRRTVDANPSALVFTATEYIDLASGHIELQYELTTEFDAALDPTVTLLLQEARHLFQRQLQLDPVNEEAIYGMASTFSLTGNDAEAEKWIEMLD